MKKNEKYRFLGILRPVQISEKYCLTFPAGKYTYLRFERRKSTLKWEISSSTSGRVKRFHFPPIVIFWLKWGRRAFVGLSTNTGALQWILLCLKSWHIIGPPPQKFFISSPRGFFARRRIVTYKAAETFLDSHIAPTSNNEFQLFWGGGGVGRDWGLFPSLYFLLLILSFK